MRTLLKKLFIDNWQRKLFSLFLAIVIWMLVNYSLTTSKTVHNIPIKILNLPQGKTIEGLQSNNILSKKISLRLTGNKASLDHLSSSDLEVTIDAEGKKDEWIATISKKNLVSRNSEIDLKRNISQVHKIDFIVKLSKLVKEQIPVVITNPFGEPPKGYHFIDVFPYRLALTVNGPENVVKRLKMKGVKLQFNLNELSKQTLDALAQEKSNSDEISFKVPEEWKQIHISSLSEKPLTIDDPKAKNIRIDLLKTDLVPINKPIQIQVFYPEKHSHIINPHTHKLLESDFIHKKNGLQMITSPLYAKGVSKLFTEIVKDHLQVVAIAAPRTEKEKLYWNVHFLQSQELEDYYVSVIMSQSTTNPDFFQPHMREEYLRNRFRSYMNQFRLCTSDGKKLSLHFKLKPQGISVTFDSTQTK